MPAFAPPPTQEKIALVTGGSRGIGRAIVLDLARAGWTVVFSYRSQAGAAQAVQAEMEQLRQPGFAVQAELASAADREELVNQTLEAYGGVDLLVNNAGMAPRQRVDLLEMGASSYDEVMDANLKGPFFLTQRVARVMIEQMRSNTSAASGSGNESTLGGPAAIVRPKIINIGSLSADTSSPNRGEYCLSKAGLGMLTQLFADRLAADGILVYEVRPGIIRTDMTTGVQEKYDRLIADGLLPLRRWGEPADVARAVTALAEGALPYSTGEVINVDGGFHLRRL